MTRTPPAQTPTSASMPQDRQPLRFDNDKGSGRSKWVAGAIAVGIIGWMGSGFVMPAEEQALVTDDAPVAPRAVTVAVRRSVAEEVEQVFVAEGQAVPDRDTMIRAEATGQIAEVLVSKGDDLAAGQVIARFDTATRTADLRGAEEELARAQREFDNASALVDRGIATADRVSQAQATLAVARASVTAAEQAIGDTEIRAPFAGRLEALDINEGEYVATGSETARIVDNTPLTIGIQIPQQSLADIRVGQTADVRFITGVTVEGVVRYVGTSASADTRTFAAEIEVPNDDGAIPAGISAQLRIPTGTVSAHFVSPAILSLDTDGTLGIKTVEAENVVAFHPVTIVQAQTDGIWIAGVPDEAQIISIGQGFVNDGETVDPQPEGGATDPAGDDATAADEPLPDTQAAIPAPATAPIIDTDSADPAPSAIADADQ
ncbi:membrane fusion protein, multidrug efflux system [Loktanella fryxellensis]|uniref:Membrane fusion protein, multidrug efflux system n=1 Tax=Loktanella fryxellensis TaxID=245187 RepID=A0A1H8JBA2_9RHOB|nr:efflux RND transporter periplasmic adaptor subunit [Loktanella fryxellensis]SEN78060.1 membrane fusion protein, multidrug efflux system [Loktanella fryxellensis]